MEKIDKEAKETADFRELIKKNEKRLKKSKKMIKECDKIIEENKRRLNIYNSFTNG